MEWESPQRGCRVAEGMLRTQEALGSILSSKNKTQNKLK